MPTEFRIGHHAAEIMLAPIHELGSVVLLAWATVGSRYVFGLLLVRDTRAPSGQPGLKAST